MNKIPLVLLTRPQAESQALAVTLQKEGYSTFIEPMLTLEPMPVEQPDWKKYDAVIFTSAHAIEQIKGDEKISVFVVGRRTAVKAQEKGFKNLIAAPTVGALMGILTKQTRAKSFLYLRGKDITADIASALPGLKIEEQIVYDMKATQAFSRECTELLTKHKIDVVLFFSRRSAETFMNLAQKSQLFPAFAATKALCLGQGVVECLKGTKWAEIHEAPTPDQAGILKKLYEIYKLKKQA